MNQTVVKLHEIESGIVQITMEDRVGKNTFTNEMREQLIEAFEAVENNLTCKVVILTGYDSYFSSGATKEGLQAINEGRASFTDSKKGIYSLALECKIPVIAAMQGHGIGGGFAMGLFADFVIFSRESIYTTNFMRYGFTPGMGATLIVPKKLGISLGEELLIRAATYRGEELERRGIPFPVLPRKEIADYALALAREIAEKPRNALIALKDNLVEELRNKLPKAIEKELHMHEMTFRTGEVKERIERLFGQ